MSSNQTCDVNSIPDLHSLIPKHVAFGALARRNDTLIAMQKCCSPNPVNFIGDCVLWCELPENLTGQEWADCTKPYITTAHGAEWSNEGTFATAMRPSIMGVAMIALLISSLYAL
ncbi:hypothetical protein F5Y07DRAFT_214055 [Xylaria sp. FL0933]|nr:hypothetical protein F5Y07DRAFT_214055 [Xylaria sp. FL0933]